MRHQPPDTLSPSPVLLTRCPSLAMGRVSDGHDMEGHLLLSIAVRLTRAVTHGRAYRANRANRANRAKPPPSPSFPPPITDQGRDSWPRLGRRGRESVRSAPLIHGIATMGYMVSMGYRGRLYTGSRATGKPPLPPTHTPRTSSYFPFIPFPVMGRVCRRGKSCWRRPRAATWRRCGDCSMPAPRWTRATR